MSLATSPTPALILMKELGLQTSTTVSAILSMVTTFRANLLPEPSSKLALTDTDTPQKVMGLTPAGGHEAGKDKSATMTLRINPANIQPAGSYQNRLTFIATPLY